MSKIGITFVILCFLPVVAWIWMVSHIPRAMPTTPEDRAGELMTFPY